MICPRQCLGPADRVMESLPHFYPCGAPTPSPGGPFLRWSTWLLAHPGSWGCMGAAEATQTRTGSVLTQPPPAASWPSTASVPRPQSSLRSSSRAGRVCRPHTLAGQGGVLSLESTGWAPWTGSLFPQLPLPAAPPALSTGTGQVPARVPLWSTGHARQQA